MLTKVHSGRSPYPKNRGAARGDPEEARKGVNGLKPEPTAQYPETIESRR